MIAPKSRLLARGLFSAALTLFIPSPVSAQDINFGGVPDSQRNMIHARVGSESAFTYSLGYTRLLRVLRRPVAISGELTLPIGKPNFNDFELRTQALAPIVGEHNWRLGARLAPTLRGLKNDMAYLTTIGLDMGLVGGYYGTHWFVLGGAGYEALLSTHVHHSDEYRKFRYEDAKNGWYAFAGGNFYAELVAGYSAQHFDLLLKGGPTWDAQGNTPLLPFFAAVGANAHF